MSSEKEIEAGAAKPQTQHAQDASVSFAPDQGGPYYGKERQQSTVSRRMSEAVAIQLAAEGSAEIDDEIAELEAELAEHPVTDRFVLPNVRFKDPRHFTWLLVMFASMGGMLSGLDQSVISGALLYMPNSLHLSTSQISLTSSGVPLGAIGGALILGPVNERFGRKAAIIIALALYTIGGALEAGAVNFGMIVGARVILGMGLGLEGGTVPVYVAESVEKKYRGNLVSLYQFMIAFGEVVGYIVAAIFVNVKSGSWRYMLGSSLIFSTIMLIGMLFMPESPRMLMHKGRTLEAFAVWKRIRGLEKLENRQEFFVMHHALDAQAHEGETGQKRKYVWLDFIRVPRARRSIIYANIMIALGQLTGINAIMYFMSTLMKQVGFDSKEAVFMSLVGGGALLLGTIPGVLYMERFGRRFWANIMLPCFFVGLVLVGVSYQIPTSNFNGSAGVYLTGIIIYNGFFGSYACLTWVLPSEVFPTYLRSYGMESTDVNLFFCSWLVTYFFADMQRAMTKTGLTLGFYGGVAVVGWIYQILFMPETKNKTLEEIDLIFSKPTSQLVAENLRNTRETMSDLLHGRFSRVFSPVEEQQTKDQLAEAIRRESKVADVGV